MVALPGFPSALEGEDISLRMFGVADDNSFTSDAVDFRHADLTDLTPGSILITYHNVTEISKIVSLAEIQRRADNNCKR